MEFKGLHLIGFTNNEFTDYTRFIVLKYRGRYFEPPNSEVNFEGLIIPS